MKIINSCGVFPKPIVVAVVLAALWSPAMQAAEPGRVNAEKPLLDPWVPPALRSVEPAVPTQGAALQAQVERKLREHFNAADIRGTGAVTREQAQAAGLGFVVNHFDQIDQRKTGTVKFDDIKHFLRERGAQLN